jgi:hypothetical protein
MKNKKSLGEKQIQWCDLRKQGCGEDREKCQTMGIKLVCKRSSEIRN